MSLIKRYFYFIYIYLALHTVHKPVVYAQVPYEVFRSSFFAYESIDPNPTVLVNDVFYVSTENAALFATPDSTKRVVHLNFRETIHVLKCDLRWCSVRTHSAVRGYIPRAHISNVWLRATKSSGRFYVYRGSELVKSYIADFGTNIEESFKTRRGTSTSTDQWITPEGLFYITGKNENSEYYKAFLISYPNMAHADRGLRDGIITRAQYQSIKTANEQFKTPPMNTGLGGLIEVHGNGTSRNMNWTRGCIALRDAYLDELWNFIPIGAPILIEP